jgi:hypothetical protein
MMSNCQLISCTRRASHHVQHAMRGGMEVCYKHAGVMLESGLCDDPQPVADTIQTAGGQ